MTRSQKLWRCLLIAVIALPLGAALIQGVRSHRQSVAKRTTADRLKRIELALHKYHEQHRTFPPAFVKGPDGRMWHSWRTLLLPYLGETELAAQYRFDEPWDGPHNRELAARCPEVFQSPHWGTEPGKTNFYGVIGPGTAWPADHPITFRDATDGTTNTIHLVEGPPVATWLQPRDLSFRVWIDAFRSPERVGLYVALMDGSVRCLRRTIEQQTLLSLLTPSPGKPIYASSDWPEEQQEPAVPPAPWKTQDVGELASTDVLAAASIPLDPAKNQIWCATSQIAWDELRNKVGGAVQTTPTKPIVDQLNAEPFDRSALSPETYQAGTTDGTPSETQALRSQLKQKFPQTDVPLLDPVADGIPRLRLFASLIKTMPFEDELERFTTPLKFKQNDQTIDVVSYGCLPTGQGAPGDAVLPRQLFVGDYISDEDFILILLTNSKQKDHVILAHSPAGHSLRATWKDVAARLKSPHSHRVHTSVRSGERLEIPILEFGLKKSFQELIGLKVTGLPFDGDFDVATESIMFRLDEKGGELISVTEYGIVGDFGDEEPPPFDPTKPRRFVFDQPFFIALREQDATEPYFLGWIAHPEVMVRSSPQQ
jgi:Protein of unknown function (DUF1559)